MAVPSGHTAQPTAPTAPTPAVDPADTGILATIAAYEKACVTKDVEGMLECMAPNVTWYVHLCGGDAWRRGAVGASGVIRAGVVRRLEGVKPPPPRAAPALLVATPSLGPLPPLPFSKAC